LFVQDGPRSLGAAERAQREAYIRALADEAEGLAAQPVEVTVQYQEFEEILGALHAAGFFPAGELVSNVAFALEGVRQS
jgi:hypothetical protein